MCIIIYLVFFFHSILVSLLPRTRTIRLHHHGTRYRQGVCAPSCSLPERKHSGVCALHAGCMLQTNPNPTSTITLPLPNHNPNPQQTHAGDTHHYFTTTLYSTHSRPMRRRACRRGKGGDSLFIYAWNTCTILISTASPIPALPLTILACWFSYQNSLKQFLVKLVCTGMQQNAG